MKRLLVVALVIVPGAAAAQSGRPLAIEDYYRVKTVSAPALSPDGKWVAFTVSTRTEATNADSSGVWLVASDGAATPNADGVARDDQRRRQLSSLELVRRRFDAIEDVIHECRIMPRCDDLFGRLFLFKIQFEYWIELVIRRQRLIVELSGSELRRRSFLDNRFGNNLGIAIVKAGQLVNLRLQNVANDCQAAVRVAI